jgi:RNA polymerase-associated protein RTF1
MKALKERFWTDADINARIAKSKKYEHIISSRSTSDSQPKLPSASEREAQRIAELNAANRKADSERVRKALIEERRRDIQDRKRREAEWQKKKAEEEAKKKAEDEKAAQGIDDLFDSRAGTPRAGTPKPGEKKEKKKGLPTFRKPKMDDDIIAGMDLGLEIEI